MTSRHYGIGAAIGDVSHIGQGALDLNFRSTSGVGDINASEPSRQPGKVILWAQKLGVTVVGRHTTAGQITTEDTGGWETQDRPTQRPVTVWSGGALVTMRLELLFDRWFEQQTVAVDLLCLRTLAARSPNLRTPASLVVIGAVPYTTDQKWVINGLTITEQLFLPRSGACARATAAIDLLEYSPPGDATTIKAGGTALTKRRIHIWKAGDTLHDLAKHYLGDASRGNSIRQANSTPTKANPGIKSFENLKPGTPINIPSRASVSS
jgi:nucleoid-associated protein YgaU